MFRSMTSTLVIAWCLVSARAIDDGLVCSGGTSASGECIGADSMVQVQHRPHKTGAVAKDGGKAECPPQTRDAVWCPDHYDKPNVCNETDSTASCLAKGMQLCESTSDCLGVGVHPGWWTGKYNGVKFCTSATLAAKPDWCTSLCPLQSQTGVWCPDHYDEENICDDSDSTSECLAKGKQLCDTKPDCFGVGVHPGWWTGAKNGVKLCNSATLVPKDDWCTAITKPPCPSETQTGVWCPEHYDVTNICNETDSTSDCLVKGVDLCETKSDCFGVGVHPGWWTKEESGVKICTSATLVDKVDWCTKITTVVYGSA